MSTKRSTPEFPATRRSNYVPLPKKRERHHQSLRAPKRTSAWLRTRSKQAKAMDITTVSRTTVSGASLSQIGTKRFPSQAIWVDAAISMTIALFQWITVLVYHTPSVVFWYLRSDTYRHTHGQKLSFLLPKDILMQTLRETLRFYICDFRGKTSSLN